MSTSSNQSRIGLLCLLLLVISTHHVSGVDFRSKLINWGRKNQRTGSIAPTTTAITTTTTPTTPTPSTAASLSSTAATFDQKDPIYQKYLIYHDLVDPRVTATAGYTGYFNKLKEVMKLYVGNPTLTKEMMLRTKSDVTGRYEDIDAQQLLQKINDLKKSGQIVDNRVVDVYVVPKQKVYSWSSVGVEPLPPPQIVWNFGHGDIHTWKNFVGTKSTISNAIGKLDMTNYNTPAPTTLSSTYPATPVPLTPTVASVASTPTSTTLSTTAARASFLDTAQASSAQAPSATVAPPASTTAPSTTPSTIPSTTPAHTGPSPSSAPILPGIGELSAPLMPTESQLLKPAYPPYTGDSLEDFGNQQPEQLLGADGQPLFLVPAKVRQDVTMTGVRDFLRELHAIAPASPSAADVIQEVVGDEENEDLQLPGEKLLAKYQDTFTETPEQRQKKKEDFQALRDKAKVDTAGFVTIDTILPYKAETVEDLSEVTGPYTQVPIPVDYPVTGKAPNVFDAPA